MNKNQIRREVGVGLRVLDQHLQKLLSEDVVVRRPSAQGKEHLYFRPEDQDLWENEATRIMFGRREARDVGLYVAEHPGATSKEIAEAIGKTPMTARHHLRTLRDHGIVTSADAGRKVEYHPLRELRRWVEEHGEVYDRPWENQ